MKHFIIFFEEKEGTSPLVRLLNNFDRISIVHQVGNSAWEPFDHHSCGPMSLRSLEQCLELIFNDEPLSMERLNRIYTKTAKRPLEAMSKGGSIGFKMRFRPPRKLDRAIHALWSSDVFSTGLLSRYERGSFKGLMVDVLKRNHVVVFFAVRQDTFRWALSQYHGDGTGKPGHLQFKLASGRIRREDIQKIHVDCDRLEKMILRCEQSHAKKWNLMDDFKRAGIEAYPLRYEDFVKDKVSYFQSVFEALGIPISAGEITSVVHRGSGFEKVHSDEVSDFVINHREVMERHSHRFVRWQ